MRRYRSSEIGGCTRAQIARQLGMAPVGTPDSLQAMFNRGKDHEIECLAAMASEGWKIVHDYPGFLTDEGQVYGELAVAGALVTMHLDGISVGFDPQGMSDRNLEIKSPVSWAKWERAHRTADYSDPLMNRYAWQISCGMALTGLEAVVACVEDGQVRTFGIEVAPHSLVEITKRVSDMEHYVKFGDLPQACSQADGWSCGYRYLCDDRPDTRDDEALDALMGAYADFKAIRDGADADMKGFQAKIDAHLGVEDTIRTEAGTATRVTRQGSVSIDWKAAEADGVDLGAYKRVGKPSIFVKVTPRDDVG